jgi:hypothetical protein
MEELEAAVRAMATGERPPREKRMRSDEKATLSVRRVKKLVALLADLDVSPAAITKQFLREADEATVERSVSVLSQLIQRFEEANTALKCESPDALAARHIVRGALRYLAQYPPFASAATALLSWEVIYVDPRCYTVGIRLPTAHDTIFLIVENDDGRKIVVSFVWDPKGVHGPALAVAITDECTTLRLSIPQCVPSGQGDTIIHRAVMAFIGSPEGERTGASIFFTLLACCVQDNLADYALEDAVLPEEMIAAARFLLPLPGPKLCTECMGALLC